MPLASVRGERFLDVIKILGDFESDRPVTCCDLLGVFFGGFG
jgi:hypothetical protein